MRWAGKPRKTVFILGAGATRGAVPHVVVNRKRLRPPLNGDFFGVVGTFARARDGDRAVSARYHRLSAALKDEFPTRGRWPLPMETAFSLLYVSKDFPGIYARGRGRQRRAGTRTEIEDFLRLTFGVLDAIGEGAKRDNLYSALVRGLGPSDCVITLNYDTVLDQALIRDGWRPERGYALRGGSDKVVWKIRKPPASANLSAVRLLKLHGSLNWLVKGSYARIQHVFDAKTSKILIRNAPPKKERAEFIRQIIPPIYGKFFNHPQWQALWERAYRAIIDAEAIVVVGCSLVETDFHLTGMLGHAVRERKKLRRSFDYAVFVDRTKVRHKWQRLLKGNVRNRVGFPNFARFIAAMQKEGAGNG